MLVGVIAPGVPRQVELDHVVLRAGDEFVALRVIDHVIGRSDDVAERSDLVEVVVQRLKGKHLRHGRGTLTRWRLTDPRGSETHQPGLSWRFASSPLSRLAARG